MTKSSFPTFVEDISKNAILHAGKMAKEFKKKISVTYKSENQPVTNADLAIDNYLKSFFSFGNSKKNKSSKTTSSYFSSIYRVISSTVKLLLPVPLHDPQGSYTP